MMALIWASVFPSCERRTVASKEVGCVVRFLTMGGLLLALAIWPAAANAEVFAHIDISEQRLHLYVDGEKQDSWPVSTGLKSTWTPTGTFQPYWLHRHHRSSLFRGAPMPYSVFFSGHYAIHGTNQIKRLGTPASHGCIRLHPKNAATLFNLILRKGKDETVIEITH
jgi:lipoprotein-anchoring transpeptidase ErfK/SrfK